ncbi:hypothetical protein C8R44DRAFT_751560 [Mycena epipterygia]|nr:hypothetical protein C8R44DRAFT_751560 [Mycena epipterygia]
MCVHRLEALRDAAAVEERVRVQKSKGQAGHACGWLSSGAVEWGSARRRAEIALRSTESRLRVRTGLGVGLCMWTRKNGDGDAEKGEAAGICTQGAENGERGDDAGRRRRRCRREEWRCRSRSTATLGGKEKRTHTTNATVINPPIHLLISIVRSSSGPLRGWRSGGGAARVGEEVEVEVEVEGVPPLPAAPRRP